MVESTRKCLGKRILLIKFTFPIRVPADMMTEAENQFQGKSAERKKKV
jgi:hypothetical protein